MTQNRLLCASANPHKVREIEFLLKGAVTLVPRPAGLPEVVEDADTLIGNARLKARAVMASRENGQNLAAVADDTGLYVEALPGALGVRTARYAVDDPLHATDPDRANRRKLLRSLADAGCLETVNRRAHFVTVALVCFPDGAELVAEGRCDGHIAVSERGSTGFGFDPLFVPDGVDGSPGSATFAELGDEAKNASSHRARAFRALAELLTERAR
ncbi:MAG: non-canonical purine NTP pyrophosphatase [Ilumatobacteraceae bacterium]